MAVPQPHPLEIHPTRIKPDKVEYPDDIHHASDNIREIGFLNDLIIDKTHTPGFDSFFLSRLFLFLDLDS